MAKQTINNVKLGFFVLAGSLILIVSLYIIGTNQSFFGADFKLRTRFRNVSGLTEGNNVRFSGIQAGTVKDIRILNDTTIEVTMLINEKTRQYIRKNSVVTIGSEGLMGNKVINIETNPLPAAAVEEDGLLPSSLGSDMGGMMQTLSGTNENIAIISEDLKQTVKRINSSRLFATLFDDSTTGEDIRQSLIHIKATSYRLDNVSKSLEGITNKIEKGKGTISMLLNDTAAANDLKTSIRQIKNASGEIDGTLAEINVLAAGLNTDIQNGKGTIHALLKDSVISAQFSNSMYHIEKGTAAFSEDMEALKHNFLFRRYFKRQARTSRPKQ